MSSAITSASAAMSPRPKASYALWVRRVFSSADTGTPLRGCARSLSLVETPFTETPCREDPSWDIPRTLAQAKTLPPDRHGRSRHDPGVCDGRRRDRAELAD